MTKTECRIVYMGTPDFAVLPLRALAESGYRVTAAVTQPDKPKGRSRTPVPPPVKEEALRHGIPVLQPEKIRDPDFVQTLRDLAPDLIVVTAFGQILPGEVLRLPGFGCLNVHASLLPRYRGASPIQQAIIAGEEKSGVTIMRMDDGLDTGDILSRAEIRLAPDETGGSLFDKLAVIGAKLLTDTIPAVLDGTVSCERQPAESPTPYASMITKEMGRLDFSRSAGELERLVRGLNPWPSAFTSLNGKTLKVWRCRTVPLGEPAPAAGTVTGTEAGGICVACGSGGLILEEVQLEGKKRMTADAFLRGCPIPEGTQLGR